jgi:anion-transporting  ArsA/GET3 family ATPase
VTRVADVVVLVALLGLVAIGGWWVSQGALTQYEARIANLEAVADSLEGVLARQRAVTDSTALRVREAGHRAADANLALGNALDTARFVLAAPDTTVKALRVALAEVVAQAEGYQAEVLTYQGWVDTLIKAHLAERQATAQQVQALQAVIDEQARALEAGRCSTFFGPCPTRWQSFTIGGLVAAVVLALL